MVDNGYLVGGFSPTPLKNDGLKVSWDDDIPFPTFCGKSSNSMVPNHPPAFQSPTLLTYSDLAATEKMPRQKGRQDTWLETLASWG